MIKIKVKLDIRVDSLKRIDGGMVDAVHSKCAELVS